MGASAFGILAQRPEKVHTFMTGQGLALPILIDADRAITKRYGVYHPLGLVRFMYVGEGQKDRPDPETIVAELRKLN
ncbi:MAG: Redoxin protein [candidate division NC10 bacterium]|nr:Redoxin protein [candidate division NC10 bacterium]